MTDHWEQRAIAADADAAALREQLAEARARAHDLANSVAPLQLELTMARDDLARAQAELEAARAVVKAARRYNERPYATENNALRFALDQCIRDYDEAMKERIT